MSDRAYLKELWANEEFSHEVMVFALRDLHHDYSLGLTTVLHCLRRAEDNSAVPPLPVAWWFLLFRKYGQNFVDK
jgi:hypothetical protein